MPNQIMLEDSFFGIAPNVFEPCDCSPHPQSVTTGSLSTERVRVFHVSCNFCQNEAEYTYELQDNGSWMMIDDD